ncbi:hypothetical protein IFM51744_10503 [Aspergillus udagawae]|nr:hypothetical protein IFM51744_10503 [Aspergillus udagawae]
MLIERAHDFTQPDVVNKAFSKIGAEGILVANGDRHKTNRRHLAKAFSVRNIRAYYPDFVEYASTMVDLMENEQNIRGAVCVKSIMDRTAARIICATLLGYDCRPSQDDSRLERIYRQFEPECTLLNWLRGLLPSFQATHWTPSWLKQDQRLQELRSFALRVLKESSCAGRLDLVSCMAESGSFSTDEMIDEILTFLIAGMMTTSVTMQWAIVALCKYPDIQNRLREEVRNHLPRPTNAESRRRILATIETLPYLRAFCNEVLRHYPIISLFARQAVCDTTLDGVHIPKRTILFISPHASNHNPELWGTRANEFDPDRWLGNDNGVASGVDAQCAFLTFGQGPRSCIGQKFVQMRGFTQEEGIDYDKTFASVVKPMSYRALFAIAAVLDLEIEQMDVKTAFLYGYIDHKIYVQHPHHMTEVTSKVCKLRKALYRLKQAPRILYQTLTNFLRNLGFEPISADLGIFIRSNIYIAVYVDDLLIVGPSVAEIKKIKWSLRNRFQMTDLGPCSYYLGISVRRDRQNRTLYLSQETYINKVAHQFGISNSVPVSTPIEASPLPENSPGHSCPSHQNP